jgi:Rrf2 family protein
MKSILNISEAYSLALHGIALLASHGGAQPLSAHEIASELGVSEAHLSKVLRRLSRAGILKSSRGPKGGFSLDKPMKDISLMDIYESVEGPLVLDNCLIGTQICGGESCVFDDLLKSVNNQFKHYLEDTTVERIKDVIRS